MTSPDGVESEGASPRAESSPAAGAGVPRADGAPPRVSIFRWDLDKTYLRTDFESLRKLLRVPFERAADKVDVPGVAELIRCLRHAAEEDGRRIVVQFVSASPPQIGRAIRDKFALDGIEVDEIVFKDQLSILMRGKFRGLREQVGFKLTELLRSRTTAPEGAREFLFGDDWEADAVVYSLYADAISRRLSPEALDGVLAAGGVDRDWRERVRAILPDVPAADAVRRIFIHLERVTPPGVFHGFSRRVVPAFNYLQTSACLYEEGELGAGGVVRVARALAERDGYTPEMLENSLADVVRRGHLSDFAESRLSAELRAAGLFPARRRPVRERMRSLLWRLRRRALEPPAYDPSLDYGRIVERWRSER